MPEPIPVAPRLDPAAADSRSLEKLGRIEPQPVPSGPAAPAPPIEPLPEPPPANTPDPVDEQEAAELEAALADAGVTATAQDRAAVQALAKLDAATVQTVKQWLTTKKRDQPTK